MRAHEHRANGDRSVEVAAEVHVPDHTRVWPALHRLQRVDDLHRPNLRRAADGARGQRGAQYVDGCLAVQQFARHLRREVHHVAVPLEAHQFIHVNGAELGHTPYVVAGEVDEHDVLRHLFRVLLQLTGHATVVVVVAATAACAGNGPADDSTAADLHHRLRRTARDRDVGVAQEVHVRAGVHLPQHSIEVERVGLQIDVVALREHHLEDVTGEDVLLRDLHRLLVHATRHGAAHIGRDLTCLRGLDGRGGKGQRQLVDGTLYPIARGVVLAIDAVGIHVEDGHALDQVDTLTPVVERGQRADDAHHCVGKPPIVVRHVGQVLDLADDVVPEIPHHTTLQRGQVGHDRRTVRSDDGIERGEHSLIDRDVRTEVLPLDLDDAVAKLQGCHGIVTDEAVARPAFGVLHGLQQEAVAVADQLEVRGHGRFQIAQHFGPHGDHRVLGGQ